MEQVSSPEADSHSAGQKSLSSSQQSANGPYPEPAEWYRWLNHSKIEEVQIFGNDSNKSKLFMKKIRAYQIRGTPVTMQFRIFACYILA
jgi:hypothetical protein